MVPQSLRNRLVSAPRRGWLARENIVNRARLSGISIRVCVKERGRERESVFCIILTLYNAARNGRWVEMNKILVWTGASEFFGWPGRFLINTTKRFSCKLISWLHLPEICPIDHKICLLESRRARIPPDSAGSLSRFRF